MEKKTYKTLGDYIAPYLEKNIGRKITLSQGINNNKYFQAPRQVAVDSENDQIVRTGQFAYNKATTRNGEKISIAYREGPDCTVSSAYQVFYIIDEEKLDPHYLLLWFKRPEFDRYARFKSFGSAHEFFTWEEMCNVSLPIPDIDEQRKIVAEYQTIEKRIENNNRLIKVLEETAQNIYHHTFVENIDPENLPEGWRVEPFYNYFDAKYGKGLATEFIEEQGLYPVYGANGVIGYYDEKTCDNYRVLITSRGSGSGDISRTYYKESFVTNNAFVVYPKKNYEYCELPYIYCLLCNSNVKQFVSGSAQPQLTNADMNVFKIVFPKKENIEDFCRQTSPLFKNTILLFEENNRLQKILPLLLSKLS